MAIRGNNGDQAMVVLLEAATRKLLSQALIGGKDELQWFRWAGNNRLLLSVSSVGRFYETEMRFTRLLSYDLPSRTFTIIGNRKQEGPIGDDLLYVDPAGQFVLLAIQRTIFDWPSVWRFSLNAGEEKQAKQVQPPKDSVWDWYADDAGTVRMGLDYTRGRLKVWYRKAPEGNLEMVVKINKEDADDKIWDVARLFANTDEGYVIDRAGDTMALRTFNYATRTAGETVYQNLDWDLSEADMGADGKPSAVYFTDDKDRVVWLDPRMKAIQARLERALPGSDVWVISRARDDSRMLVYSGREDDPGALYVFTVATRSLEFVANYRPAIDPRQLATPKPVSYVARDRTLIRGYLTLPRGREARNLPLIILPHGGPYGVRDSLAYDDEVQFLANRGYAVLQPNFRGSGGFGEAFENIGDGEIGRKMQDDLDDGMDWLVRQGIADAGRVCVVGASYGGYAALWSVIRNPERYRCAASFAGVTDWKKQLSYSNRGFDSNSRKDWTNTVIGDVKDFNLDTISPSRQAARLTRPVLLAHGEKDSRVPFSHFKSMRDAAARAQVPIEQLVFKEAGHGFDKPADEQRWYETLEAFLTKNNPAD